MKRTTEQARKDLVINGALLEAILNGGKVIQYRFNGWDWYFLVEYKNPDEDGFTHGQFETTDDLGFHLMVSRKGTRRDINKRFNADFIESWSSKNKAFELGNIK